MRLRVLFFGVLRDRFGAEEQLQQFPGRTVADLLGYYRAVAPELGTLWGSLAVAINQQYVTGASELNADDEVALLPPVSGGARNVRHHAG